MVKMSQESDFINSLENLSSLLSKKELMPIRSWLKSLKPFVAQDFYEKQMFCLLKGDGEATDENDYDSRCIAGSMTKDDAESVNSCIGLVDEMYSKSNALIKAGKAMHDKFIEITKSVLDSQEKTTILEAKISSLEGELKQEKLRLEQQMALNLKAASGGSGNVVVADPEKFVRILRTLTSISEKIDESGVPLSKEILRFNSLFKEILSTVYGPDYVKNDTP